MSDIKLDAGERVMLLKDVPHYKGLIKQGSVGIVYYQLAIYQVYKINLLDYPLHTHTYIHQNNLVKI